MMDLIRGFNEFLCKKFGHKEGWYPAAPWWCDRCGVHWKEEWDRTHAEAYYKKQEELRRHDERHARKASKAN
jgi:hypothetical protein